MENRRKFYPNGLWANDTLQERYEHVMAALDAYSKHTLDEQDLKFVIKNAFVSKIYVSEDVAKAYPAPLSLFGNSLFPLYDQLLKNRVLDLQDAQPQLHSEYMRVCDLGMKICDLKRNGKLAKNLQNIRVEHIVPSNVFMEEVKKITSFQDFMDIFNAVGICLITEEEDQKLTLKGLRNRMPIGIDFRKDPFARYHNAQIGIY